MSMIGIKPTPEQGDPARTRVAIGYIVKRVGQPTQTIVTVDGLVFDFRERTTAMAAMLPGLGDVECDVVPDGAR